MLHCPHKINKNILQATDSDENEMFEEQVENTNGKQLQRIVENYDVS